jgi:CdiI N-terminal domain
MKFQINFLHSDIPATTPKEKAAYGLIKIGTFSEKFIASLDFWSVSDYENHWKKAILRILEGNNTSILITSLNNPTISNFYTWWPMYRIQKTIYFQNQLFFLNQLRKPFDLKNPFKYVRARQTHNENAEKISEWVLDVNDLKEYAKIMNWKFK